MGNKNTNLHRAKRCKDDEFYTTYETIENELAHYIEQFKNKTVLCNCDNPFTSNFPKFFLQNFNVLGLKRLICTSFSPYASVQPSLFESFNDNNSKGYILDISKMQFVDYGTIAMTNSSVTVNKNLGSILIPSKDYTVVPKVLDRAELVTSNNLFIKASLGSSINSSSTSSFVGNIDLDFISNNSAAITKYSLAIFKFSSSIMFI